jgi:Transcriptional regulators containing a DNA-binding HTH domain and an aminotransferase domain (MocR family) and their eukaryotic orthologs
VPVDDDGIKAQDLRGSDRACYVTPAHQFPLGGRMPVRRRTDLLAWARAAGALVLEDDYDGEFRYDVPPLNPLRSMPAAAGHVVYLGTSSKILSRGLRVSWAVLPARFRAAMAAYLDASGEEVSQVSAAFLASFIATGALTRHQSRAMRTYRARQERFVAACRSTSPPPGRSASRPGCTSPWSSTGRWTTRPPRRGWPTPGWPASRCPRSAPGRPAGPGCSAATRGCRRPLAQGAAALIGRVTSEEMAARGA